VDRPTDKNASRIPELNGMRVLIVDDNLTNRRIVEGILAAWGMLPVAVDAGQAGLQAMIEACRKGNPFSLVLVDYRMPEMDGFALAEQIRSRPELSSALVMMLTSDDYHATAQRCRQVGINVYLIKPVKSSDLLHSILRLVRNTEVENSPITPERRNHQRRKALKILLAEDNLVNQRLAVQLLEKVEHNVVVAQNGIEALAKLEQEHFDLVLMDVQMPEMDGVTAAAKVREREKHTGRHLPIIAMTAHAMKGDRERCLASGMDGYISKPINRPDLIRTIEETLDAVLALGVR
jgi:CheY-like chemotaxis protein